MFVCGDIPKLRLSAVIVAAAMVIAGSYMARAQGPVDAGVRGRVVSDDGHALSGVDVLVEESPIQGAVSFHQVVRSTKDGSFLVLRLTPGEYLISSQGYAQKVELHAGELSDVVLRIISRSQNVKPEPPSNSNGDRYTIAALAELPLANRSWESAVWMDSTANVSANDAAQSGEYDSEAASAKPQSAGNERASNGEVAGGTSSAGLSVTGDASTFDGLSARQNFSAGPRGVSPGGVHAGATFAENAVLEYRMLPRTFSALYGGAGGGVAVVSHGAARGAPGQWHGTGFALTRESAWAATNPFSVVTHYHDGIVTTSFVKPEGARQSFGGDVGWSLPQSILPARLRRGVQVFASVEEQTNEDTLESTPQLASFYQLTSTQTGLLETRGVTANATNAALDYLDSLSGEVHQLATRTLAFARADFQPSRRDFLTLGYIHNQFHAPAGAALGQTSFAVVARGRGSIGASSVQIDALTARWLHEFSPRINQEVRAQIAHDLEFETPAAPLPQEPAIGPGGLAPQVSIGPQGFAYGTPAGLGRKAYPDERRTELADLVQVAWRGHLISLGGEWSRIDDLIESFNNAEGSFNYDSGLVKGYAGGLVDWITDYTFNVNAYPTAACPHIPPPGDLTPHYFCFHTFTQAFGPVQTEFVTHEFAGYAEDAMRLSKDLSLTLGARYEYTLLPLPQVPNYTLDAALIGALGTGSGLTQNFPEDRNNIGPRIAVSWSPKWKNGLPLLTVHVGYGVFFGKIAGATLRSALIETALPATALSIRIRPTTTTACPQVANEGFGYPCAYDNMPPAAVAQTTQAIVFVKNFRMPEIQRGLIEVERTLSRHVSVRAFYSMALAEQLPQSVDVNIAPSPASIQFMIQGGEGYPGIVNGQMFRLPLYTSRLLTNYGPVTEIESNANATYHAGTVEAQWRSTSLEARGGYTFSRAIDYAPQSGATPQTNGQLDPFTDRYDKGLSGLNFPQRFAGDLIYRVQLRRAPKEMSAALNGVRIAAIAWAGSGAPYSYGVYGGSYLSGGGDSVNGSGGATYLPTVGRNTLHLPARSNLDARVSRTFRISDRVHGEGFVEAFNLLNTVQLTRAETRAFLVGTPATVNGVAAPTPLIFQDATTVAAEGLNTPAFGMPLSSTNGASRERELEFGVRVQF